jgi:hypothetical protein
MSLIPGANLSHPSGIVPARAERDAASVSRFVPGEIMEAVITGTAGWRGVLLRLAQGLVVAKTDVPLQVNERLLVRVEQLHPQVVLRIIEREVTEAVRINDYRRLYGANPQALLKAFSLADKIFGVKGLTEGLNHAAVRDLQMVMKTIPSLILSQDTQGNSFFLRDFISGLGLLLERRLARGLDKSRRNIQDKAQTHGGDEGGLKVQLARLFSSLALEIEEKNHTDQAGTLRSRGIGRFAASFIEAIETLQVLNVFYQESEHSYLLQIPCLMPDGLRMQDLVIELDGNRKDGKSTGSSCRFVLFMDMDALGRLMIDTALSGSAIDCHIRCGIDSAADFLSLFLDQLKDRLTAAGYRVGEVTCEIDGDIASTRDRYLRDQILHATDVINLFA